MLILVYGIYHLFMSYLNLFDDCSYCIVFWFDVTSFVGLLMSTPAEDYLLTTKSSVRTPGLDGLWLLFLLVGNEPSQTV